MVTRCRVINYQIKIDYALKCLNVNKVAKIDNLPVEIERIGWEYEKQLLNVIIMNNNMNIMTREMYHLFVLKEMKNIIRMSDL